MHCIKGRAFYKRTNAYIFGLILILFIFLKSWLVEWLDKQRALTYEPQWFVIKWVFVFVTEIAFGFYPVPLGGSPRGTLAPVFLRFSLIVCLSGWTYLGFLLGNVLSSIGSRKRDYHIARCPVWCSPFQSIFQETGDSS